MNRRNALFALVAFSASVASARGGVPKPYKVSLVAGGKVNGLWQAGVLVELDADWKTYWRNPGDAGIPPQFDWAGSANVELVEVSYPVPTRFNDASGEAIGYHGKVLFPLAVKSVDADRPIQLALKMFFAVCQTVCIPASAELATELSASSSNQSILAAQQRVPVTNTLTPIVTNQRFDMLEGKPVLIMGLSQPVMDIFVETDGQTYFGKPRFDMKPNEAWIPIGNVKDVNSLKNLPLKLTVSLGDKGIEQTIMVN
jgi:DsbC/DsbD-like thiol-disulfide interchange protein